MSTLRQLAILITTFAVVLARMNPTMAHCDGMDGPVVKAAQKALSSGNVNLVLVWVQKADEEQVKQAFDQTRIVRKLSPEAQALADKYFFETLVRIHRAGEGASYTGLKPAGRDLGPAIPLAGESLVSGNVDSLVELVIDETREGLTKRFEHAIKTRDYAPSDVESGREFVRAYVMFIHYVEGVYKAAHEPVAGHPLDSGQVSRKHSE
jgi:hypothetical protein